MHKVLGFAVFSFALLAVLPAGADSGPWIVVSPDREDTFVNGSEKNRQWILSAESQNLALLVTSTNDPYVDHDNPRDYTYSTFHFPHVRLSEDGHRFYLTTAGHSPVPVARIRGGFLGFKWIELLAPNTVVVKKNCGTLTAILVVHDRSASAD